MSLGDGWLRQQLRNKAGLELSDAEVQRLSTMSWRKLLACTSADALMRRCDVLPEHAEDVAMEICKLRRLCAVDWGECG